MFTGSRLWRNIYANDLDDIPLGEYEIHIYDDKVHKAFVKWSEEDSDGAGILKEEQLVEAKITGNCFVCKRLQNQMRLWTQRLKIKCFHEEREQWRREKLLKMSIKTLMAIAVVGTQVPQKISYVEECTSRIGGMVIQNNLRV